MDPIALIALDAISLFCHDAEVHVASSLFMAQEIVVPLYPINIFARATESDLRDFAI